MYNITIDMDEHKKFFSTSLGQNFIKEMANTDNLEKLKSIVNCPYASTEIIEDVVKRLIEKELAKIEKDGSYDSEVLYVIIHATQNKNAGRETLDMIYSFAMKLIVKYQIASIPYDMGMDMIRWIVINPRTSEKTLKQIKTDNAHLVKHIVQNNGISDKWLIELVENGNTEEKLAAVPELIRRLKFRY